MGDVNENAFDYRSERHCSKTRRQVRHAPDYAVADAAVTANGRARTRGIRFARVPQGPSCGFCIMLASRGFVYATEETAGEFKKFHDHCDCLVLAGTRGVEVDGYNWRGMQRRYIACRKAVNGGRMAPVWREGDRYVTGPLQAAWDAMGEDEREAAGYKSFDDYMTKRIVAEMNTRDRRWLYEGDKAGLEAIYEKPRELLELHEQKGVDWHIANGIIPTCKLEDPKAKANIDFEI